MALAPFSAHELFDWLVADATFRLLDVRNDEEFGRFKVEGPHPIDMVNVPYMEFIEHEKESVARVPKGKPVRIVCAKEGSAKFVGEILEQNGFDDVGYLKEGIYAWGNLLAPVRVNREGDYELIQFRRPGKASCSYGLLFGKEMMVFDPSRNVDAYQAMAKERGCAIKWSFETHRQADYISGSIRLNRTAGAAILAPEADFAVAKFDYTPVQDGQIVRFSGGGPEVKAIHTPGHTPGSTSYLIDDRYLISGDTVFIYSIGRPDLGGMVEQWSAMLFETVRKRLVPMDDAVTVLPGHYMDWKEADADMIFAAPWGRIKGINRDIYTIDDPALFLEFIRANMRRQPAEYAKIRDINAGLADVDDENANYLDLGKNECAASAMGQA